MHTRAIAAVAVIVSLIGVAFVGFPSVEAAPPQPHNFFGIARDSTSTPLPSGTRITAWVDGVDYSNGTSVYTASGNYDMDVFGDNQTDISTDNTPTIKTGGDISDEIMYVAGDFTTYKALNPQQVFTAKDFWGVPTTGQSENLDLTLAAAANQPGLPKIGRITTQPADGLTQYLYLCNPTAVAISDASVYYLEKPVPGAFNGPTHAISGAIGPFGGILYVNLTSWAPTTLVNTGDALKLVWNNPGGPAFQGSDIIVDRVEYNGSFSPTFVEPVNTIMTDALAPAFGQEIRRIGGDFCQDTNNNSVDFGIQGETGRPGGTNTAPSVVLTTPSGGEDWTGNTLHTIFWNQSDLEDSSLTVALSLSINSGSTFPFALPGGSFANSPPPSQPWTVNCVNATNTAMIRIQVFDSGGMNAESFSNLFSIDCARPTLTSTVPPDTQTSVNVNTDVTLTFSEGMNPLATDGAISFFPLVAFTTTWGPSNVVTVDPTGALVGSTLYTVTISCAAKDDSDTGNLLAACPRTFSFTTGIAAFAPTVDLTDPDGGEVWSGGSPHNILWTMSDADTAGNLLVTLEYNIGAGWIVITASLSRPQGSNFFSWTVPCPSSAIARVRATVSDGVLTSQDTSAADFTIDCTAPSVISTLPGPGAIDVGVGDPIIILFSEAMDQASVQTTFTLPGASGIVFIWTASDTLQVSHSALLTCTAYTATVPAAAKDLSDPGVLIAAAHIWTFNTECAPTVTISAPTGGELYSGASSQTIQFTVTDTDANVYVWVNWTSPSASVINQVSRAADGSLHSVVFVVPFADVTNAQIQVTAQDSTGLNGVDSVVFSIDSTPPTVTSSVPAEAATNVAVAAPFVIIFSEAMDPTTDAASISVTPSVGTLVFTWTSASSVTVTHAQALQTNTQYTLSVSTAAQDASTPGNALAAPYSVTFTTSATGAVTADAGGPYTGTVGTDFRVDGSSSLGAVTNWTWEITHPDGSTTTFEYGDNPLAHFPTAGTYNILLTVRDAGGNTDTDTTTALISAGQQRTFFEDYWWLFVILIIAIILALLFAFMRRKKKEEEPMPPEVPPDQVDVTPPTRAPPARPMPPPPAGAPAVGKGAPRTRDCPSCGTILDATDTECFMCGTKL